MSILNKIAYLQNRQDSGIKTPAAIASKKKSCNDTIFPFLIEHLKRCRSKDVPQRSEAVATAVNSANKQMIIDTVEKQKKRFKHRAIKTCNQGNSKS